jgi:chaperone required for assembly of F1-ATPase
MTNAKPVDDFEVLVGRVASHREHTINELLEFLPTDHSLYRHENQAIRQKQEQLLEPIVKQVELKLGIRFGCIAFIASADIDEIVYKAVSDYLISCNNTQLTYLALITNHCASVLLAIAVNEGMIATDEVVVASRIEEHFQVEQWGEKETVEAKTKEIQEELRAAYHACRQS